MKNPNTLNTLAICIPYDQYDTMIRTMNELNFTNADFRVVGWYDGVNADSMMDVFMAEPNAVILKLAYNS